MKGDPSAKPSSPRKVSGVEDRAVRGWTHPAPCGAGTEGNGAVGPTRTGTITETLQRSGRVLQRSHMASAAGRTGSEAGDAEGAGLRPLQPPAPPAAPVSDMRRGMSGSRPGAAMRMEWDSSRARSAADTSCSGCSPPPPCPDPRQSLRP